MAKGEREMLSKRVKLRYPKVVMMMMEVVMLVMLVMLVILYLRIQN